MLSLILFVFGFLAGFLFCAWMMGQKKSANSMIIDAEWEEYKRPDKIDTWA